ncbi:GNAT family N-acetyltransferase [Kribbella sp. NBC_01245]|uniref:GNAT family N-acetyltransferase n=1 Tax=Kribbella sp. NBC_01245 TaxID=2903578 RepID=UPI002E28C33C|nr:GNAT family N-acetyltransferase [Kribbella sp. NBC_01245]
MSTEKTLPAVTLRLMTEAEFGPWREISLIDYTASLASANGLDAKAASDMAGGHYDRLLPDGVSTTEHLLWFALDEGEPVGSLWIHVKNGKSAFIYMLLVDADQRGRGYGRAIMLAAEDECRARDLDRLELNVFGQNRTAINLYDSLGYEVTTQQMRKLL